MIKVSRKLETKTEQDKVKEVLFVIESAVKVHFLGGAKVEDGCVVHIAKDNGDGVLNVTVS